MEHGWVRPRSSRSPLLIPEVAPCSFPTVDSYSRSHSRSHPHSHLTFVLTFISASPHSRSSQSHLTSIAFSSHPHEFHSHRTLISLSLISLPAYSHSSQFRLALISLSTHYLSSQSHLVLSIMPVRMVIYSYCFFKIWPVRIEPTSWPVSGSNVHGAGSARYLSRAPCLH
jgi:hypothetical protein